MTGGAEPSRMTQLMGLARVGCTNKGTHQSGEEEEEDGEGGEMHGRQLPNGCLVVCYLIECNAWNCRYFSERSCRGGGKILFQRRIPSFYNFFPAA